MNMERAIGEIQGTVNAIHDWCEEERTERKKLETRVGSLERSRSRAKGAGGVFTGLAVLAGIWRTMTGG